MSDGIIARAVEVVDGVWDDCDYESGDLPGASEIVRALADAGLLRPEITEEMVERAARAMWERDNAEGTTAEWRDMAWRDMGGSEPAEERVEYLLRARALAAAGLLATPSVVMDELRIDQDWLHIYWRDPVEGCWVAYRRVDCVGEEELPAGALTAALVAGS